MNEIIKTPYNKLNEIDKSTIIESYYQRKDLEFGQLSDLLHSGSSC